VPLAWFPYLSFATMSDAQFDPCKQWLGIDAVDLSDPRRVLGLLPSESDPLTVLRAAAARLALLQGIAPGPFDIARNALLKRVEEARETVLAQIATLPRAAMAVGPALTMPRPPSVPVLDPNKSPWDEPPAQDGWSPVTASRVRKQSAPAFSVGMLLLVLCGGAAILACVYAMQQVVPARPTKTPSGEVVRANTPNAPQPPQDSQPTRSPRSKKRAPPNEDLPPDPRSDKAVSTSGAPIKPPVARVKPEPVAEPEPEPKPEPEPEPEPEPKPEPVVEKPAEEVAPFTLKPAFPQTPPMPVGPNPAGKPAKVVPPQQAQQAIDPLVEKLTDVLTSLQNQEFAAAAATLDQAAALPGVDGSRIDRWEKLVYYAKEFAVYREQALAAVTADNNYEVNRIQIGVVEIDSEKFIYRAKGKNMTVARDKIPSAILITIVEDWFDEKPANNLFLGAYHATKPEIDIQKAREKWQRAQAGGAGDDAAMLLEILDDPVVQEFKVEKAAR